MEEGEEAIRRLTVRSIDIALLDIQMPDVDGLQILQTMQRRRIGTDSVVLTGDGIDLAVDSHEAGPASGSLPPGPPGSAGVESSSSAFEFGISESYVCRQFRDGLETTFRARLNRHRINKPSAS